MEEEANKFYFFMIPMKYGKNFLDIKSARTIIFTGIACYPIMYLIIRNFELDGVYLPESQLFKGITFFFFVFIVLSMVSFLFYKFQMYDAILWFLVSISFLSVAYFLILMEYLSFVRKYISTERQGLVFNILLLTPIVFFVISFIRYSLMIYQGKAHKEYSKVVLLEQKFKNTSSASFYQSETKKNIIYASFIGVGLSSMIEISFTLFIIIYICACFISFMAPRFLIVSYVKSKFPKYYL